MTKKTLVLPKKKFTATLSQMVEDGLIPDVLAKALAQVIDVTTSRSEYFDVNLPVMDDNLRNLIGKYTDKGIIFLGKEPFQLCELRPEFINARMPPRLTMYPIVNRFFKMVPLTSKAPSRRSPHPHTCCRH